MLTNQDIGVLLIATFVALVITTVIFAFNLDSLLNESEKDNDF